MSFLYQQNKNYQEFVSFSHTLCVYSEFLDTTVADQDNGEGKTVKRRVVVKKAVLDGSPTMFLCF